MAWHDTVRTGLIGPVTAGMVTLGVGFGGFAAWAALAPIEGAVVAPGKVAVDGRNKPVQHLEGGIVGKILVGEGERVAAGDALLVLDGTAAKSAANRLRAQLAAVEAGEARALAERDGAAAIAFPAWLAAARDAETERLLADQQAEFVVGLRKHRAGIAVLEQQIAALEEKITGYALQRDETVRQLELAAEERTGLEVLLAQGLTRKSQVLALKRSEAELRGRQGQLAAAMAEARQAIAEISERIEQAETARIGEASARLGELRLARTEVLEALRAAEDVSERLTVRAPAAGTVVNLAKHSAGAVIAPGETVMTIVPQDADLVIEARIRPQDIDEVRVGQHARLGFSALDQRQMPTVAGLVTYVSADRFENERTGEAYYLARLEIADDRSAGFDPSQIGPGFDAEIYITTGERTFFGYLAAPLTKTLARSFRES